MDNFLTICIPCLNPFTLVLPYLLCILGTVYALVFACDKQTLTRIRWKHIKVQQHYVIAIKTQSFLCIFIPRLQAAFIRWCGKKPVQEYQFEHSDRRETIVGKRYQVVNPINSEGASESIEITVSNQSSSYTLYK